MATSIALPNAPRRSLVETTIDLIRAQVEGGTWKIGEQIPKEQELADMLQVSRNTVREAIRVLSHANVLDVRQGDGTYVRLNVDPTEIMRRVSRAGLREHFELRAMLETEAARLAAANRSEADVKMLRKLLEGRGELRDHETRDAFADADLAFHGAIARACGNAALAELYRYFSMTVRVNILSAIEERDLPEPDLKAHNAIIDAIAVKDEDGAAEAARAVVAPLIGALTAVG
ncbi:FadR/GntR family transcriptional regulator [Brucella intermedia]|uniref:FadR/GntR family transcriptional regulator n=1 Tax=Brucella intermedia TaxID=94625 RepID=UPI00224B1364|nr:FCD domain-containing protein [Brucella intermedia]